MKSKIIRLKGANMKKYKELTKVLIFRCKLSDCISKVYNYRAFKHDLKRKIFVIVHFDYQIEIRDFNDYSLIGQYYEKV